MRVRQEEAQITLTDNAHKVVVPIPLCFKWTFLFRSIIAPVNVYIYIIWYLHEHRTGKEGMKQVQNDVMTSNFPGIQ